MQRNQWTGFRNGFRNSFPGKSRVYPLSFIRTQLFTTCKTWSNVSKYVICRQIYRCMSLSTCMRYSSAPKSRSIAFRTGCWCAAVIARWWNPSGISCGPLCAVSRWWDRCSPSIWKMLSKWFECGEKYDFEIWPTFDCKCIFIEGNLLGSKCKNPR